MNPTYRHGVRLELDEEGNNVFRSDDVVELVLGHFSTLVNQVKSRCVNSAAAEVVEYAGTLCVSGRKSTMIYHVTL